MITLVITEHVLLLLAMWSRLYVECQLLPCEMVYGVLVQICSTATTLYVSALP